jgi:predicted AlkP superfamily pyrophosphatase or phosphodiesterase
VATTKKVLLVGIDGLILNRAIDSGRAPTLAALRSDCYYTDLEIAMPTVSGPSWTTLLTGKTQAIHKVVDNDYVNHNLADAPDLLTQAAKKYPELITYAAAGWPPLIDPNDVGPVIATRQDHQEDGRHSIFVRDGETNGYELVDPQVAADAIRAINEIGPDLSFIYFCGADEAGHLTGTIEGSYFDAIESIDSHLAQINAAVHNRSKTLDEEWLLVITTDHGHRDEGGHGGDSPQERASFIIAHGIRTPHPTWPATIKPEDLAELLVQTLA